MAADLDRMEKIVRTEVEWLARDDLFSLWWFLRYRSNKRKARLYTVACCHQIWHRFVDPTWRRAVEVSELFADREASLEELIQARNDVSASWSKWNAATPTGNGSDFETTEYAGVAAERTAFKRPDPNDVAQLVQSAVAGAMDLADQQRLLFHDLAGPRLFRPVAIKHSWLAWNNATVVKMAQTVYSERNFELMPLLADALEEAGCADADILGHCRSGCRHVRGCWVVDSLLGKS